MHKNVQERLAAKRTIIIFAKMNRPKKIHLHLDNKTALSAITESWKTKNPDLTQISKSMWDIYIQQKNSITSPVPSFI